MVKFFLIAVTILFLDQVTKYMTKGVHTGIINYTTNTGAGFSILQGQTLLLIIISVIVLALILYYRKKEPKYEIPLVLIFAGTLGNIIDRIVLGYVRDFIDVKVWPVFNIADISLVVGTILLIYFSFKIKKK